MKGRGGPGEVTGTTLKAKIGPVLMNGPVLGPCLMIWGLVFFVPPLTGEGLKGEVGAYRNPRLQQLCFADIYPLHSSYLLVSHGSASSRKLWRH